jgi:hypothetical protein
MGAFSPAALVSAGVGLQGSPCHPGYAGEHQARYQNELIRIQNLAAESNRRAALIFELTDILNDVNEELDNTDLETTGALSAYLDRSSMEQRQQTRWLIA